MGGGVHRVAAIDIGTVTTRLLVADVSERGVAEVLRSTDITHLGEGLTQSGTLSSDAMARVGSVVGGYVDSMERLGVEAVRAVATSASRDASNSAEFTEMLAGQGVVPEVVPGREEARLAFSGAAYGRSEEHLLVNDIGGGSTEIVFGAAAGGGRADRVRIDFADSVDVGSRRLTEVCLRSDPPSADELEAARAWVAERLAPVIRALPAVPGVCVSLAGTATTLSAIDQGLAVYDPARVHDSVLGVARVRELTEMLASLPLSERVGVVGLDPGRAPVIVAGGLILEVLLDLAESDSTLVSEHDILYGIVLDLAADLDATPGLE